MCVTGAGEELTLPFGRDGLRLHGRKLTREVPTWWAWTQEASEGSSHRGTSNSEVQISTPWTTADRKETGLNLEARSHVDLKAVRIPA